MNLGALDLRGSGILCVSKFGWKKEGVENHEEIATRGEPAPAPYKHLPWIVYPDPCFRNPYFKRVDLWYIILDNIYWTIEWFWPLLFEFGSVKSKEQLMNLRALDLRGLGIVCALKFGCQKEGIENAVEKAAWGEPAPYKHLPWIVDPDMGSTSFCWIRIPASCSWSVIYYFDFIFLNYRMVLTNVICIWQFKKKGTGKICEPLTYEVFVLFALWSLEKF